MFCMCVYSKTNRHCDVTGTVWTCYQISKHSESVIVSTSSRPAHSSFHSFGVGKMRSNSTFKGHHHILLFASKIYILLNGTKWLDIWKVFRTPRKVVVPKLPHKCGTTRSVLIADYLATRQVCEKWFHVCTNARPRLGADVQLRPFVRTSPTVGTSGATKTCNDKTWRWKGGNGMHFHGSRWVELTYFIAFWRFCLKHLES